MFQNVYEMMLFTADKMCKLESRSAHKKTDSKEEDRGWQGKKNFSKVV